MIDDGWFMVRVLDLPGVISQGISIEHARKMIKDALCLIVGGAQAGKRRIASEATPA